MYGRNWSLFITLVVGCSVDVEQPSFGRGDSADADSAAADSADANAESTSSSGMDRGDDGPDDDGSASTADDDDPTPQTCGNGQLDAGEQCDGPLFAVSCEDFGFEGGELQCMASCMASTAGCIGCGNGVIEAGEACDADALGGESCVTLGFGSGALACDGDCNFDTTACVEPVCGDGALNGDEVCDGQDFGGQTCTSVDPGFVGGQLTCADDCATIDTSACLEPVCGDGMANGDEVCDGNDFAGQTCKTQGFNAGNLTCAENCAAIQTDGCLYCAEPGQSCASEVCCPGTSCTDFGFNIVLCI